MWHSREFALSGAGWAENSNLFLGGAGIRFSSGSCCVAPKKHYRIGEFYCAVLDICLFGNLERGYGNNSLEVVQSSSCELKSVRFLTFYIVEVGTKSPVRYFSSRAAIDFPSDKTILKILSVQCVHWNGGCPSF